MNWRLFFIYTDSPPTQFGDEPQLLYYLAGSLTEAIKINGIAYMPIIVYHTSEFNKKVGEKNKSDYMAFMDSLQFICIKDDEETLMYENVIDGVRVYSSYIEVMEI